MVYTVLFFSSSEIALPLFDKLLSDGRFELLGLVCQPDKPAHRDAIREAPVTKHFALTHALPVFQPERLAADVELFEHFSQEAPDFVLSFAYGQLIPDTWLTLAKIAALNVHPSLLPLYRGPSPIQTAILNGDAITGVTLIKMVHEMDAGHIAGQISYKIPEHATSHTLFADLGALCADHVPDWLEKVAIEKESIFKEQDQSKATFTKKIEKEDGRIDFKKSAAEIFRRFRAFIPWPGIFTTYKGLRLKLCEVETSDAVLPPGQVRVERHFVLIGTSDGSLKVNRLQLEGKNVLYTEAFILGQPEFCSAVLPS